MQKVIDQKTVLDIESLRVEAGQIAALVGPVDSGTSRLFELFTGRERPTLGSVQVAGLDPYQDRVQFGRQAGVLFSVDNLYQRQSTLSNLKFYCRLYRLPASRASEVLEQVGLAETANTTVEKLSSGFLRRLAFGRAILHRPKVLLLEEPFARCEEASVAILSRLIREWAEAGASALIFSDATDHLTDLCDPIYRLDQGRIAEIIRPQEGQRPDLPFMIPARLEDKVALVDPADILYIYAKEDRAFLQTLSGSLPTQFTMAELEKRLARSGFFRAHRGYLVNLQHVKEVIPYTRDSYSLRLKDGAGTEIPLSKSAARELRDLLGY